MSIMDDKILLELDAIADMSSEQVKQLSDMITFAYIGTKLDTDFVANNISVYSALDSKAILVIISNIISKEICEKAIEIVAFIRSSGKTVSGVKLLDVLGVVKPRTSAEIEYMKKDLAAWEQAQAEVGPIDLNSFDLETDEGFNQALDAIVSRNEHIAERAARIRVEQENADIEKDAQDAMKSEQDEFRKSILSGAVNEVVTTILKRYATLYSDLFVNPAMGVITPRGILGATKDNSVRNVYMESAVLSVSIYNIISQLLGDTLKVPEQDKFDIIPVDGSGTVRSDLFNYDGTCNYSYLPKLQAHLVAGIHRNVTKNGTSYVENGGFVKSKSYGAFSEALRVSLSCDIAKIIHRVFKDDVDIMACIPRLNVLKASLIRLYTTTFIAEEVVPNKVIRMRMSSLGAENQLLGVSKALLDAGSVGLGTEVASAEILNNSVTNGVLKLTLSLDKEAFTQETLFAYEALERVYDSGNTVDMGSIVVGRKLSGELMCINLASPGSVVMSVQGAGRSGKGVLTLSMLGTMVGSGCPFIYIDNKPDMAALLWQLEREYGTKILSVDVTGKTVETIKTAGGGSKEVGPIRQGTAYNIPSGLSNDMYWSAFAYAKLATLYTIAMHCKGTGKIPELDALPLFFAIFDEASSASKVLSKNYVEIQKVVKADKTNEAAQKLKGFLEALSAGLGAIFSNYPDRGLKIMVLSQSWNLETWRDPAADSKTPQMFYPLVYGASMRLLGTDNTGTQQNALGGATAQGKFLISPETMGHFAFSPKNRAQDGDVVEVFKSYLVLNNNDFDTSGQGKHGKYVGGMLSNLKTKPTVYAATSEKIAPGGVPEARIGFSGLLQYIGEHGGVEVAETLGVGYKIMDAVATLLGITGEGGKYVDIEDWLYDCTPETFWSYAELKNLVDTGAKVTDIVSEDEVTSEAVVFDKEPVVTATSSQPANVPDPQPMPEPIPQPEPFKFEKMFDGDNPTNDGIPDVGETVDNPFTATPLSADELEKAEYQDYMAEKAQANQPQPMPQPQPQQPQQQRQTINPQLAMPFPQFQSLFQRQSPQIQQQTIQYQQIFGTPCIYSDATNVFYSQDADGFLIPVSGQYAVPPNMRPRVYQNETRTDANIVDTTAPHFIGFTPNGVTTIDEQSGYTHGRPIQGPEVRYKGKVKPITHNMSIKKLESAMAQRWAIMLQAGAKVVGDAGLVARVTITEYELYINGVAINAADEILGEAGLRVTDVVDFAEMFKYYKGLKQLDLNYAARIPFGAAYSNPAIPFTQSKSLQVINFTDSKGNVTEYTRQAAANRLQVPEDKLTSHFNTWTAFASQVNKGQTSSFCKPGSRLRMADYTKRLAVGAFGPGSTWSKRRRALGALGMLACAAGTVVTGGVQVARASRKKHR